MHNVDRVRSLEEIANHTGKTCTQDSTPTYIWWPLAWFMQCSCQEHMPLRHVTVSCSCFSGLRALCIAVEARLTYRSPTVAFRGVKVPGLSRETVADRT
jgi:hypothetical protein